MITKSFYSVLSHLSLNDHGCDQEAEIVDLTFSQSVIR